MPEERSLVAVFVKKSTRHKIKVLAPINGMDIKDFVEKLIDEEYDKAKLPKYD